MNNTPNNEIESETKARAAETARKIWMFLTPIFALAAAFSFYNWTQGSSSSGVFSQLGLMFVGLSIIVGKRNKILYYILLAAAMILVFTGLALIILKFRE